MYEDKAENLYKVENLYKLNEMIKERRKLAEEEYKTVSELLGYIELLPDVDGLNVDGLDIDKTKRDCMKRIEELEQFLEKSEKFKIDVSFYKSIVDQDRTAVVICNLNHEIIYMNPAAVQNYGKKGGKKLIGKNLLDCHSSKSAEKIQQVVDWFSEDESHNIVYTYHNEKQNKDVYMVALRDAGKLIGYYEKHEYRNAETMPIYDLW
jgi:PAS domain-containing protein